MDLNHPAAVACFYPLSYYSMLPVVAGLPVPRPFWFPSRRYHILRVKDDPRPRKVFAPVTARAVRWEVFTFPPGEHTSRMPGVDPFPDRKSVSRLCDRGADQSNPGLSLTFTLTESITRPATTIQRYNKILQSQAKINKIKFINNREQ
jgi:hypothetical protein